MRTPPPTGFLAPRMVIAPYGRVRLQERRLVPDHPSRARRREIHAHRFVGLPEQSNRLSARRRRSPGSVDSSASAPHDGRGGNPRPSAPTSPASRQRDFNSSANSAGAGSKHFGRGGVRDARRASGSAVGLWQGDVFAAEHVADAWTGTMRDPCGQRSMLRRATLPWALVLRRSCCPGQQVHLGRQGLRPEPRLRMGLGPSWYGD